MIMMGNPPIEKVTRCLREQLDAHRIGHAAVLAGQESITVNLNEPKSDEHSLCRM